MSSSLSIDESFSRLKAVLGELLNRQSPTLSILKSNDYPLLILETCSDSVGFAVVNGTPKTEFNTAYDSFKELYRQRHDAWKDRNLSFVICRSEHSRKHDEFYGSIEANTYFCRKYVVSMRSDTEDLERELLRLPFTPLPDASEGGVNIPPSAQTLLQNINVPASLADKIVNPGVCSAKRLISELVSGEEPLPILHSNSASGLIHQAETKESTRIRSVSIEAFRAYRKRQEFDLDADVVVLYGPNGLGKTSFFDALDYACTGRIGRLCQGRINQKEFINIARHLDAPAGDGLVSMQINKGDADFLVSRKISDWSTALIGEESNSRASLLQFLTSAKWSTRQPRINKLESIFRATHLFSQTDPELLMRFDQDSTLSHDLVSRMLALDDYASGLAKVAEVQTELDKQIKQNLQEAFTLKVQDDEVQSKIKSLPEPQDEMRAGKQLRTMATRLVRDLKSDISVTIEDTDLSQASAREWRAVAESALKDANDNLLQLKSIEFGFGSFSEKKTALKHNTTELTKLEDELKQQNAVYKRKQKAMKKLTSSLEQERGVLDQTKSRIRALSELSGLQDVALKTNNALQKWQKELARVAGEQDTTAAELQPLLPVADGLHNRTAEVRDEVRSKSEQIQALTIIQEGLPSWKKNHERITKLEQSTIGVQLVIETTNKALDGLKVGIAAKEKELKGLENEYGDLMENEGELTRLLDEIETHVRNGICPTCGTNHTSKNSLVKRIHSQKQARPAHVEALAIRRGDLRSSLKQDKESLAARVDEKTAKGNELKEMEVMLAEVRELVVAYENIVGEAGLPVDQQLAAILARKVAEEILAHKSAQESLTSLESEQVIANKQIKKLERKQAQQDKARKRADAEVEALKEQIAASHAKVEAQDLSLEMSPDEIAAETKEVSARKARALDCIDELAPQVETSTQATSELKGKIIEVTQKIESLRQNKSRLENELGRYEESAAGVIGRGAIDLDTISKQKKLATERVDRLDDLRRRSLILERAMDASQRSAMLAELEAQSQSIAKKKKNLGEAAERMAAVMKWFSAVKSTLYKQNSIAVANYVDAFGPLTTLIQKRLRAVYGFGDVSLNARGDEIHVKVGRKGEQFKPADYFSDSQKQILMLSLFLAGRLTQTWSGFAPILMDDPVTHFDDLNAFGFVEFIRGIISTSPDERQFFISTCEERLFDLMRKKFNSVDGGAKFYRLNGIGPDGPSVKEIVN